MADFEYFCIFSVGKIDINSEKRLNMARSDSQIDKYKHRRANNLVPRLFPLQKSLGTRLACKNINTDRASLIFFFFGGGCSFLTIYLIVSPDVNKNKGVTDTFTKIAKVF